MPAFLEHPRHGNECGMKPQLGEEALHHRPANPGVSEPYFKAPQKAIALQRRSRPQGDPRDGERTVRLSPDGGRAGEMVHTSSEGLPAAQRGHLVTLPVCMTSRGQFRQAVRAVSSGTLYDPRQFQLSTISVSHNS